MNINELENEIALLNTARYADGPNKGKRLVEVDRPYARNVFAKQVQLTEAKAAEAKTVRISPDQMHGLNRTDRVNSKTNPDLAALERALGAKNDKGVRHVEVKPALRAEIEGAMAKVYAGGAEGRVQMSPELSAIVGAK